MNDPVVLCEHLSKQYRIGREAGYKTLRESLTGMFRRDTRQGAAAEPTIWALKDVSFELRHGEVGGIIGPNGAGKSTLLKILTRITKPTEGQARIRGRVGSLLEVGTGFHPELTGRENVYLNGAILGMSRAEIRGKFDQIVEFSGVSKFLDTPVKRYSSGMYMRLAFAVAAHLEPEILIVDEVLAVGDAAFQKKCLGKMGDVAREGRTVLFVSHNMPAIQSLCSRVLWLDSGGVVLEGPGGEVVSRYLQSSLEAQSEQVWSDRKAAPGNEQIRLRRVAVRPVSGSVGDPITTETPVQLEVEYWNLRPGAELSLALHIYNEEDVLAFVACPTEEPVWQGRPFPSGLFRDVCTIPGGLLNDGMHRIELFVLEGETNIIFEYDAALVFHVQDTIEMRGAYYGKWPGVVRPKFDWQTEFVEGTALP